MTLRVQGNQRYDMPASFGPSQVPEQTEIKKASVLALSCPVSADDLAEVIPVHFNLPEKPNLTVAYVSYQDVDYLGGRGYNEIVISLDAQARDGDTVTDAPFALVLWVNQVGALIAGREFMGLAKLPARIPSLQGGNGRAEFSMAEDEHVLLRGRAEALQSVSADRLQRINDKAGEVRTFGWKYIPNDQGAADADYPLVNVMRWRYDSVQTGEGDFQFIPASKVQAPLSHAAVTYLSGVRKLGPIRAFYGEGSALIDRKATRRIQ